MDIRYFDYPSLTLYLGLGIWGMICVKHFFISNNSHALVSSPYNANSTPLRVNWLWGVGLVWVFAFWATFRKVAPFLGGIDSLNYIEMFQTALMATATDYIKGDITEPLFFYYCQNIRLVTDNYLVFFAISYSLIPLSYLIFIKTYCSRTVSYIPFCLLVFPFLHSWCTLRSSLAIALFLIGLSAYKKNRAIGAALIFATFGIHRMSAIYIPIVFFIWFFEKKIEKISKWKLLFLLVLGIVLSILGAYRLQSYIVSNRLLDGTDLWYLKKMQGTSLLTRYPMFFAQSLLLIVLLTFENMGAIKKTKEFVDIKTLCYFDFILLPATIVCGFWRANQFLYVARLILWGMLIKSGELYINGRYRFMYRAVVLCLFLAWLSFRIYSEYYGLGIMPYKFLWW